MEAYYHSKNNNKKNPQITVLFTGGRDSSLTACLLANKGKFVHLITCNNGTVINSKIATYRYNELKSAFEDNIVSRTVIPTHGLFRRVALAEIEDDFKVYGKNLILLGDQLAIHSQAILYCLCNGIKELASGFVTYEKHFAEQNPTAIALFKSFAKEYGIKYSTPVYRYKALDDIKYHLMDFGVSTKSLEGFSIFADTFSQPTENEVKKYIKSKLPICRKFIELKLNY
jgi:hypothetical protein